MVRTPIPGLERRRRAYSGAVEAVGAGPGFPPSICPGGLGLLSFAFWSFGGGEGTALADGIAAGAAGCFVRMPAGVCRPPGLVSLGGRGVESVGAAFAGGVMTGVG
jgi:hypothetical protein